MTKIKFLQCKRYLYLYGNNSLNSSDKFAKVRPLFNAIDKQCILNYRPTQHVSIDKFMITYFEKHGAKQYIYGKSINFGFKLLVKATPLVHCIQLSPQVGKDSIPQEYKNIELGLGTISSCKLSQQTFCDANF